MPRYCIPLLQGNIIVNLDHVAFVVVPDEPRLVMLQVRLQKLQQLQLKMVFKLTNFYPRLQKQLCKLFNLLYDIILAKKSQLHKQVFSQVNKPPTSPRPMPMFVMFSAQTGISELLKNLLLSPMMCSILSTTSNLALVN